MVRPEGNESSGRGVLRLTWILVGVVAWVVVGAGTTASQAQRDQYPAPSYPRYLVTPSQDLLLQKARIAVRQSYGRAPLGKMQSGQRVHVFLEYTQDMTVWDAIKRAWAERGVEAVGVSLADVLGMTKPQFESRGKANLIHGGEGWKEIGVFQPAYVPFLQPDAQKIFGQPMTHFTLLSSLKTYIDKHQEIQFFFQAQGGRDHTIRAVGPANAKKFVGNWIYTNVFELAGKEAEFPGDVWNLVDDRIIAAIPHVAEGTFEDPLGTHLRWALTPAQTRMWAGSTGISNHLNVYPSPPQATWIDSRIRAVSNHTGYHPILTASLSPHGRLAKVEGGGKYGDLFRMLLDHPKMRDAKFPSQPETGYWYLTQDGFATNPKFVRNMPVLTSGSSEFANLAERNRAGVQHFSFSAPDRLADPRDYAYAEKTGLPTYPAVHTAHMHVFFTTVRWKLDDTGEWITISDKGQLKVFNEPELRALAAKYGDPNLIFRYEWVPEIPGVNVPGDIEKDYGADPWKWLVSEWGRIQNGTYGHFVDDYQMSSVPAAFPPGM